MRDLTPGEIIIRVVIIAVVAIIGISGYADVVNNKKPGGPATSDQMVYDINNGIDITEVSDTTAEEQLNPEELNVTEEIEDPTEYVDARTGKVFPIVDGKVEVSLPVKIKSVSVMDGEELPYKIVCNYTYSDDGRLQEFKVKHKEYKEVTSVHTETYEYDDNNNLVKISASFYDSDYEYDFGYEGNRITSISRTDYYEGMAMTLWGKTFDPVTGDLVEEVFQGGVVITAKNTYNDAGMLTKAKYTWKSDNDPDYKETAKSTFEYDSRNQLVHCKYTAPSSFDNPDIHQVEKTIYYDEADRFSEVSGEVENEAGYVYDEQGRISDEHDYDPDYDTYYEYTYDDYGNIVYTKTNFNEYYYEFENGEIVAVSTVGAVTSTGYGDITTMEYEKYYIPLEAWPQYIDYYYKYRYDSFSYSCSGTGLEPFVHNEGYPAQYRLYQNCWDAFACNEKGDWIYFTKMLNGSLFTNHY